MSEGGTDNSRRRFLTAATTVVGAVGAGFVAVPFIKSWNPSARTKAAGAAIEIDISKLDVGQMLTVEWRGKPIYIVKRSDKNLEQLSSMDDRLRDPGSNESVQPDYAKNVYRARSDQKAILVLEGVCTHLGCAPKHRPDVAPADLGSDWVGGFFCPCHGSRFDLAGRVFQGVPAPLNLRVPPYTYLSKTTLLVGDDGGNA